MGWTDLHSAAYEGDVKRVRKLLKKGADPNTQSEDGDTPLHVAVSWGHVDVVKLLLEHGADPNIKNENGWTPLYRAASEGRVDIVKLLLEHGANPSARDKVEKAAKEAEAIGLSDFVKNALELEPWKRPTAEEAARSIAAEWKKRYS